MAGLTHQAVFEAKRFREWLIGRMTETSLVSVPLSDDDFDAFARVAGVDPDALAEARAVARINHSRALNDEEPLRVGARTINLYSFMPEPIHRHLSEIIDARALTPSLFLRSLVHTYLLGSWEPPYCPATWSWRGTEYELPKGSKRHKHHLVTKISFGARNALELRARHRRLRHVSRLVRGLLIDVMEGRFAQPGKLRLVDPAGMPDAASAYYLPES